MSEMRIDRRAAMGLLAGAAGSAAIIGGAAKQGAGAAMSVTVVPGEAIGTIKPALYSQFAEHIGGVIYDGIWVGPDSKIANVRGIRKDIIDHVKRIGRVVVRWPGGCFADSYHWRDGIGPVAKRPRRFGRWREETEPNTFGTREFIDFCRLCEVEPYLAANVGGGTQVEFQNWVEYCNAPAGRTTLADDRVMNGDPDPFKVRYWGVGNESWGCGGKFTPEDYCTEFRKFTEWVPEYGVPLYLIAAGPNGKDPDWTRRFFKKWADGSRAPISGWAPHYYCGTTGHALKFSTDQWFEMFKKALVMEPLLTEQWSIMGEYDREHKIKFIVDEWGAWHPPGTEINGRHLYEQMGCLRDALVAALTLDIFNRHADKIDMANIAQLVNNIQSLFLADGDKFVTTPNFHVFEMYRAHHGGKSVRIDVQAPLIPYSDRGVASQCLRIAGSASIKGQTLTLTLVNTHPAEPAEVDLRIKGMAGSGVSHVALTHRDLSAHNTFERPDTVVPKSLPFAAKGETLRCVLPPASVNRFEIRLGAV